MLVRQLEAAFDIEAEESNPGNIAAVLPQEWHPRGEMSVDSAARKVESSRRELDRQREKQATEEARAARLDSEAARIDEQAARTSSPGLARSHFQSAQRKHADARRARETAAKVSRTVFDAQKKLHQAEAELAREKVREEEKAREKAKREQARIERERKSAERRQRDRERLRDREVAALRERASDLEAQLRAEPWSQSPEEIDVLFIAASPENEPALRLDREVREIQRRVRMSEHRDAVRFHWRPAARTTDLLQALNEIRPHVVHFSGHGSQDALIFEDSDGLAKELSNSDLAQLLHISSDRIRLAVFKQLQLRRTGRASL